MRNLRTRKGKEAKEKAQIYLLILTLIFGVWTLWQASQHEVVMMMLGLSIVAELTVAMVIADMFVVDMFMVSKND